MIPDAVLEISAGMRNGDTWRERECECVCEREGECVCEQERLCEGGRVREREMDQDLLEAGSAHTRRGELVAVVLEELNASDPRTHDDAEPAFVNLFWG